MTTQTAEETLNDLMLWRPALKTFLAAFSPLLMAIDTLTLELAPNLGALTLPSCQPERLQLGISLLADLKFPDISSTLAQISAKLATHIESLPSLRNNLTAYQNYFANVPVKDQTILLTAVLGNDATSLSEIAQTQNLDPATLHFLANFYFSCLLRALVLKSFGPNDVKKIWPWEENNTWQQGYCPVCGAYPTIAWLDKPSLDERNTYLVDKGGRKHLHCGLCGANWRFLRLACPNCGINETKQLEMLTCTDLADQHGESLDYCSKCNGYYPVVDLRNRDKIPNLDAQALGMLHLDLIAQDKNLQPLRVSFWNSLA